AQPRWRDADFVSLSAGSSPEGSASDAGPRAERERWVVAVNLRCPHCVAHLRRLGRRIHGRDRPPALAALVVDQPMRPRGPASGLPLAGGVWWDSAQVWRESWGRRAYGETFRFDASGRLLSATPAGVLPDSVCSRL